MNLNETKLHFHSDDWMNDPKLFFWEGEYHVFYQYAWPRQWAHIKSTDLIHWEELPVALKPDPEGPDAGGGCWTGCCIRAYDQFHIFYTGTDKNMRQTTCHAVSDDLVTWRKDPANPLIRPAYPYKQGKDAAWRDPCIWEHDGWWYMAQAASICDDDTQFSGCFALMRSRDLKNWEMLPPLYHAGGFKMCECPDIFPLDNKYVALFSCFRTYAALSSDMFGPYRLNSQPAYIDNDLFYAAKTLADDKGRRIAWGFIFESCGMDAPRRGQSWEPVLAGRKWLNVLSFPRELSINRSGRLECRWPEELLAFRKKELKGVVKRKTGTWSGDEGIITGKPDGDYSLASLTGIEGAYLEISAKIKLGKAKKAGIAVRCSGSFSEITGIYVDRETNSVRVEDLSAGFEAPHSRVWDGLSSKLSLPVSMPLNKDIEDGVEVRIIVDGSVIEVLINNSSVLTARSYTLQEDSIHAALFTVGGDAEFTGLKAWELGL